MKKEFLYSTLTIKAMDEEKREITGIASSPEADRVGDIVDPNGAEYKLPIPLLWQHDSNQPIGEVISAKVTKAGIEIRARLAKVEAPSQLAARLEEAWASIKTGLVRGLSIGFRPLEYAFIEDGGIRFDRWEWFELSAVTIPANANATISAVKSFDRENLLASSGAKAKGTVKATSSGVSETKAKPVKLTPKKEDTMKTIAEQLKAFRDTLEAKRKQMAEVIGKAGEAGETLAAADQEEFDGLNDECKEIEKHIERLEIVEKANVSKAAPVVVKAGEDEAAANAARHLSPARSIQVRAVADQVKGLAFARLAKCKALARMEYMPAFQIAESLYKDDPRIANILKATVSAGTTSHATWAGPLVGEESAVFADFVEFLRPQTILGRFGTGNIPALRGVPFRTRLVGQTTGGNAAWVGEAKAKPLTKFDYNKTTLEPLKVANIAVITMELLRDSSPNAELLVRDGLADAIRARLDIDFIDPAKAASAGVSPASITNGITPIASSGTDANAVRCDIATLLKEFVAANNSARGAVIVMSSQVAIEVMMMQNPLGQREFPGLTMDGGELLGFPVITSEYITADSSGSYVVMVKASDIYLGDEGGITVDMSDQASLQMDGEPTNNGDTPTPTTLVSLWQDNLVGFRAERTINWARRRESAVAVLDGVAWTSCET